MTAMAKGEEETAYEWDPFDHLAKAEGPGGITSYAYDALGRLSERKGGEATQVFHYGDLTDSPTYEANGEGETTTSYVAGPKGLLEQRSAEATAYPLADSHGDITAITGPTGSVESRQSYGPWGKQLSGPSLEMGYLGAYERPTDQTTGLIQMGARSYSPELGAFMSQDPVLGRVGVGVSANRYPYVWDNPLNRYDLNGREVCLPTLFGNACPGEAAEDLAEGAEEAGEITVNAAESAWDATASARSWIGDRASDFWKATHKYVFACLGQGAWGAAVGAGFGAAAGGAGAIPGAISGGLEGCGQGIVEQGLRDSGHGTAAEILAGVIAGRDVGKAGRLLGRDPQIREGLRNLPHIFY